MNFRLKKQILPVSYIMLLMLKKICLVFCLLLVCLSFTVPKVNADELEEIEKKLSDLKRSLEQSQNATAPLEQNLTRLEADIAEIKRKITVVEKEVKVKEKEVSDSDKSLALQQKILEERVRSFYKSSKQLSGISLHFFTDKSDLGEKLRLSAYRKSVINEDKKVITEVVLYIKDLEKKKKQLESQKVQLSKVKTETDKQALFFKKEITGAKAYQAKLGQEIKELSARQNELVSAKVGLFSTSVGEVPLADDPASRPDYNPGFSPAFAAFSFGAPHFRGMSQYGAFGRAKNGQNHEEILKAYYGNVRIESPGGMPDSILTDAGSKNFEDDYLKGIAEMPSQWASEGGTEALKAQAIAARSYALAYTGWRMADKSVKSAICTSEQCQVYRASKVGDSVWAQAVSDTRGKILVSNGSNEVVNSWYASTSGGYMESYSSLGHSTPGFWDTKNGRSGWTSDAYEKIGGSPWFYKGWYKTRSGTSCSRNHPWLTSAEFADIVNAAIVYANGGDISGIFPEDVKNCFGGNDEPWSKQRLKDEADKYGGGITAVSSVSVQYQDNGLTGKVTVNGRELAGDKFYKAFNLRAPGAIHLKSGLYNIEKK